MSTRFRYESASPDPFWIGTVSTPFRAVSLKQDATCDLAIVGGGFSGLWSALKAREQFPDASIVLLEGGCIGNAASGRNGGFCAPSISHGVSNAVARWPQEAETLVRLGRENLDGLEQDLQTYAIDGGFERSGKLNVAATPWQVDGLRAMQQTYARFGIETTFLEGAALDARFNTPRYQAGLYEPNYALVNPARLVDGLAKACVARGVEIYEDTQVTALTNRNDSIVLTTAQAVVKAQKVILATNAAVPLLRRLRPAILPIWDYSLMSEPLSDAQLAAIGWQDRYGIADSGNQFHYFRKTQDNRILWGGYDAVYYYGSNRDPNLTERSETYRRLEQNFFDAFPALEGIGFTHRWGGIIDTSARLTAFAGTAMQGRMAYAMGFTGQGVSATRFGALTMLDLLAGRDTERTRLKMLRSTPVPFPPEPLRHWMVKRAQADLAREDETGERSLVLRTLDRLRIGFGS
ncbi:NAD(P)/FAD-dependent oxidoreductase [Neptunicoccus cionae]|uniref:NAD(P)/FAD-dependent oxidoreductase n=1 Tax=Neptunicoccus cionae TaxID=2035344 RepID=UPI000C786CFF|nr:FAD-dependent oxidoreductase [Amylibacter cionae]PLS21183.1 FAD-dependent oxidoreductase [Amylibacter cionae]